MASSHDLHMPSYPWKLLLWIHLIKGSFWLQMCQLNKHQLTVLLENLTSLPFCSTVTKQTCNALTMALPSLNKIKNTTTVLSAWPTQTVLYKASVYIILFIRSMWLLLCTNLILGSLQSKTQKMATNIKQYMQPEQHVFNTTCIFSPK